jgi:autotransporter-associated beta strand protein
VFNFGDSVTFDDTGAANSAINLTNTFLSAPTVTVNSSSEYDFNGSGSFAGLGMLRYIGTGQLHLNNANTYSGGTLISNASAFVVLANYAGLGQGPVTNALAGAQMELTQSGGANTGINGDIVLQDDFTMLYDKNSSFGAVLFGNLSGTAGKTLTIVHNNNSPTDSRVRAAGTNTVCNLNINLQDATTIFASYQATGNQIYNGLIYGAGSFMMKGTTTYLNNTNTYSGPTIPATGAIGLGVNSIGSPVTAGPVGIGPLSLAVDSTSGTTGNGQIFASGGPRTLGNDIQYPTGSNNLTLTIGGTNALTLSGSWDLAGKDGATIFTNRIVQVTNTALTTVSGVISESTAGFGLQKTGNGTLVLSQTESYTGPTAISNGTLRVSGQIGSGAVTVGTNAVLGGNGTVTGPVTVLPTGAVAPGASIGTLTITNDLILGGNLNIEVNRSASPSSDKLVVSGALTNSGAGTLTVSNLGSALLANDSFTIFNKPLTNGSALTVTGGGVNWTNKLAVDGTIAVLSVIPTTATNITFAYSGTNLTLSWPATYTGWALQSQTNPVTKGLSTNWVTIPGSTATNRLVMPIGITNGSVFYRMSLLP